MLLERSEGARGGGWGGGGLAQADHPLFFMNHLLGNPKVIENQLLLTHL